LAELVDFSRIRCETPGVQEIMLKALPNMRFPNGDRFSQHLDASAIRDVKTLKAEKNTLVCRVTINVGYGADRRDVRGKFTVKQFGDGRISESWTPNY
jgi:hypothetical protein